MIAWLQSRLWQVCSIGLLLLSAWCGFQWLLASHERDRLQDKLTTEQNTTAELRASIKTQNSAVEELGKQKVEADKRLALALQLAQVNGKRADSALEKVKDVKAETCQDAMPALNQVLEELRK